MKKEVLFRNSKRNAACFLNEWKAKPGHATLGPGICVKYFLSFPQKKTCRQRKLRQTKCLLFNF